MTKKYKKEVLSVFSLLFLLSMVFVPVFAFAACTPGTTPFWDFVNGPAPESGITGTGSDLPCSRVYIIALVTMKWILAILGFIAIIGFVISGILYLTSAGNDGQIKLAKASMTYCILGVIVALVGYVVILAVDTWLDGVNYF